jgi:VanZ family protein
LRTIFQASPHRNNSVIFHSTIVTLFGIIEESYQMLIPGRQSDLLDLLADICGALFAIVLANIIAHIMRINNPVSFD